MNKLFFSVIIILFTISIALGNGFGAPSIKKYEKYSSVRSKMIAAGWSPYHGEEALDCQPGESRCEGKPEMEACSDVGLGQCAWLWKKGGKIIVIDTISGGDDELFTGMSRYKLSR